MYTNKIKLTAIMIRNYQHLVSKINIYKSKIISENNHFEKIKMYDSSTLSLTIWQHILINCTNELPSSEMVDENSNQF